MRPLLLTLCLCFAFQEASACTTFMKESGGTRLIGKSYDWGVSEGMLLINKAGMKKKALALVLGDDPAEWTSRYANLTFNQYGRGMPNGGMNTEGLVVEILWLSGSQYPHPDQRKTVNELQWIQYQLDRFSTVAEVVKHAQELRISRVHGKVHYLVCDKSGACGTFEVLAGKMVVHSGDKAPIKALTNHTYADSVAYARRNPTAPSGQGSYARFARAAQACRAGGDGTPADAFAVLDDVSQGSYSVWNIVYDPKTLTVHWRTHKQPTVKSARLTAFQRDCVTPVKMLDIDHPKAGDATAAFVDYTLRANQTLIDKAFAEIKRLLPPFATHVLAGYPALTRCQAR